MTTDGANRAKDMCLALIEFPNIQTTTPLTLDAQLLLCTVFVFWCCGKLKLDVKLELEMGMGIIRSLGWIGSGSHNQAKGLNYWYKRMSGSMEQIAPWWKACAFDCASA
jgi:hypothetical protein